MLKMAMIMSMIMAMITAISKTATGTTTTSRTTTTTSRTTAKTMATIQTSMGYAYTSRAEQNNTLMAEPCQIHSAISAYYGTISASFQYSKPALHAANRLSAFLYSTPIQLDFSTQSLHYIQPIIPFSIQESTCHAA